MSTQETLPEQAPETAPASPGALTVALRTLGEWFRRNRLTLGIITATSLFGMITSVTYVMMRSQQVAEKIRQRDAQISIPFALAALDEGDYARARSLALKIRRKALPPEDHGGPSFVLGAAAAYEAADLWSRESRNYYLLGARYLEESQQKGFVADRTAEGLFLLGKCLYMSGQFSKCRPVLEESLQLSPDNATETHLLLTGAYRRGRQADFKKSLEHIALYLADDTLEADDRHKGLLEQAQILWAQRDGGGCLKILEQIPQTSGVYPEATLLRGQILISAARELRREWKKSPGTIKRAEVTRKYDEAIQVLRKAQEDPLGDEAIPKAMYLIGICYLDLKDQRSALSQFERTRKVHLDTPEGMAAGLQEADLLRQAARDDEAVAAYRRVLGLSKNPARFFNPWIVREKFRARAFDAYRHYLSAQEFPRAVAIAERMAPLFPAARATELLAESHRTWARKLLDASAALPWEQAEKVRSQGRATMRRAGRVYDRLAKLEFTTRRYPDDLWLATECYLAGQDYSRAVIAIEEYLKYELRRRRPLALVNQGEALLSLGRVNEALASLQECIRLYSTDAASYKARLLAGRVYLEKGDEKAAEELWRINIHNDLLTPQSFEWRDSLFALGELLYHAQEYDECIERLEEAVERYPDAPQAVEAHYLLALAYREAAKTPEEKLRTDVIETVRAARRKQLYTLLVAAQRHYEQVQQTLIKRNEQRGLPPLEQAMLRNAYFGVGVTLFDLGRYFDEQRYEDAIDAYAAILTRYQHDPVVLEAFVQIIRCQRRLDRVKESRGMAEQAKAVLKRLNANASFLEATNFSRAEWQEMLDWLSSA